MAAPQYGQRPAFVPGLNWFFILFRFKFAPPKNNPEAQDFGISDLYMLAPCGAALCALSRNDSIPAGYV
jgi:hypothetical protein